MLHKIEFMFFLKQITFVFFVLLFAAPSFAQQTNVGDLKAQAALVSEFDVNGLKVLVKRRINSPTVAVGLFLRGGARNLTPATAGIESFMLSVATEASKNHPREILRRELAGTGAIINSGANYDYSAISLTTPRADFDRTWSIFTDIALNPSFAPQDVERIRQQTLTGLRQQNSDPDSSLAELQQKVVFAGHPYANDPSGTLANISKFKPEDLRSFHKEAMQTSRLLLVIVGDLDADALKLKIASAFSQLPRGNYQEKAVPALNFDKPSVEVTTRSLPTNYVQGTYAAPSPSDPDFYAMRIATSILTSLVFEEVRNARNLSYAPSASLDNRAVNTGGIYVTAVDANQAVDVMLDQIKLMQNNLLREQAVKSVGELFLTTYYLGQETNAAQAADLATNELVGGGWRKSFEFLDKIRAVTPSDVERVSQKYMRNIKFVVLGNPDYVNRDIFTKQ
ncbi:MAG: pitrilysin family protein [Pyrinomonadaceae bacterium]